MARLIAKEKLDKLYEELKNPASWHWKIDVKTGWFYHHYEYYGLIHVRKILKDLEAEGTPEAILQADGIKYFLLKLSNSPDFPQHGNEEIQQAIKLLLTQSRKKKQDFSEEEYDKRRDLIRKTGFNGKNHPWMEKILILNWNSTNKLFLNIKREDLNSVFSYMQYCESIVDQDSRKLDEIINLLLRLNAHFKDMTEVISKLMDVREDVGSSFNRLRLVVELSIVNTITQEIWSIGYVLNELEKLIGKDDKKLKIITESIKKINPKNMFAFLKGVFAILDLTGWQSRNLDKICQIVIGIEKDLTRKLTNQSNIESEMREVCEKKLVNCKEVICGKIENIKIILETTKYMDFKNMLSFFEALPAYKNIILEDDKKLRIVLNTIKPTQPIDSGSRFKLGDNLNMIFSHLYTYEIYIGGDTEKLEIIIEILNTFDSNARVSLVTNHFPICLDNLGTEIEMLSLIRDIIKNSDANNINAIVAKGLPVCKDLLLEASKSKDKRETIITFFKKYRHSNKWVTNPLFLRYCLEIFLHNQDNKNMTLIDRLKLRKQKDFKREFIKNYFRQKLGREVSDDEINQSPFSSLIKLFSEIIQVDFSAQSPSQQFLQGMDRELKQTKKGLYFPLGKIYYEQSVKGVIIDKMNADIVKQILLDMVAVTATMASRWQARHDEAKERFSRLLNNPQKIQELINFFQSNINQGAYFKDISSEYNKIKTSNSKNDLINMINTIIEKTALNKYKEVSEELYATKMEPLSDIMAILKSQLEENMEQISSVIIRSQIPLITDLYDYDTVHCCALFPRHQFDGVEGYLLDEHILLLQYITKNKKGLQTIYGLIICVLCEDEQGKTILLIDSAEGDENWLKVMKNWQETYRNVIREVAKDCKADVILYANNAGNTVPKEFLTYLSTQLQLTEMSISKKNKRARYLEAFKGSSQGLVSGYYEKINS